MLGLTGIMKWGVIGLLIALMGVSAWGLRLDHLRAYWKDRAYVVSINLDSITSEIGAQSGNPRLAVVDDNIEPVLGQVQALGRAKREWQDVASTQSERIASLGEEQVRLKQLLAHERRRAEKLIAERNAALNRLQNMELTPEEVETCEAQLAAAEQALDILFKEGL